MLGRAKRSNSSYRFPPTARIRRSAEYRALARGARRFHTDHFVVLYTRGGEHSTRVGITVSRKVGKAVVRNRIKRYVREFARTRVGCLPVAFDLVVIAKPGAGACEHRALDDELEGLWRYLTRRVDRG